MKHIPYLPTTLGAGLRGAESAKIQSAPHLPSSTSPLGVGSRGAEPKRDEGRAGLKTEGVDNAMHNQEVKKLKQTVEVRSNSTLKHVFIPSFPHLVSVSRSDDQDLGRREECSSNRTRFIQSPVGQ